MVVSGFDRYATILQWTCSRRDSNRMRDALGSARIEGIHSVLPGRLSQLPPSSFAMLATLLDPHQPGQTPISLSVGDPRGATPSFVMEALNKHASEFGEYPA